MGYLSLQIGLAVLVSLLIHMISARNYRVSLVTVGLGALFYFAQAGAQAPFLGLIAIGAATLKYSSIAIAAAGAVLFAVFEESSRWLGMTGTATMRRQHSFGAAISFGAGFGGAEATRFALLAATLSRWDISPAYLPAAVILPILLHCELSALIGFAAVSQRRRLIALAIAIHFALVWAWLTMQISGHPLAGYGVMMTGVLAMAALTVTLKNRWPLEEPPVRYVSAMHSNGIVVRNLLHSYPNEATGQTFVALRDLDLKIAPGTVLALLGHNGAGKTTTLRILGGMMTPTAGSVSVGAVDVRVDPARVRELVGFQCEEPGLYRHMRVAAYLNFFARLYDVPWQARRERIARLISRLQLEEHRHKPGGSLSKGNKQKVALARTLIHQPAVLLLDEPTSNLDPAVSRLVRSLIGDLKAGGTTVVIATHNLYEAEAVADEVAIVHRGRLIIKGTMAELHGDSAVRRFTLKIASPHPGLAAGLEMMAAMPAVAELRLVSDGDGPEAATVDFSTTTPEITNPSILAELLAQGLRPMALSERRPTLEELYLNIDSQLEASADKEQEPSC